MHIVKLGAHEFHVHALENPDDNTLLLKLEHPTVAMTDEHLSKFPERLANRVNTQLLSTWDQESMEHAEVVFADVLQAAAASGELAEWLDLWGSIEE